MIFPIASTTQEHTRSHAHLMPHTPHVAQTWCYTHCDLPSVEAIGLDRGLTVNFFTGEIVWEDNSQAAFTTSTCTTQSIMRFASLSRLDHCKPKYFDGPNIVVEFRFRDSVVVELSCRFWHQPLSVDLYGLASFVVLWKARTQCHMPIVVCRS